MPDASGFRIDAPRPVIPIEPGDLPTAATAAEQAMIDAGVQLYQRGRSLVRPVTQEIRASGGRTVATAHLVELTRPAMQDLLAQTATFTKHDRRSRKPKPIDPPRDLADIMLSREGDWRVPTVSGVTTCPTLRPDGSILAEPGYDPVTRLYLAADPMLRIPAIPDHPSRDHAVAALLLLEGLLAEFPCVSTVDRAVALSALLTPVCRGAMSVAPLHVIRASTAGTGKSFLVDLAAHIAGGRPCPAASVSVETREVEKALGGLLLSGQPIISLDNVNGELASDLLAQAVERPVVQVRRLSTSDLSTFENTATIFATGNNLAVRADLSRRTVVCNLDTGMERPETRCFTFNPVERVMADRGRYVAAALTVVRAFMISADRPELPPLASFEGWTGSVRGALVWLGRADPAACIEQVREDDQDLTDMRGTMTAWFSAFSHDERTLKQVRERAEQDPGGELNQALLAVGQGKNGLDPERLGKWFRRAKGRVVTISPGEYSPPLPVRFTTPGSTGGYARWALEQCREGGWGA